MEEGGDHGSYAKHSAAICCYMLSSNRMVGKKLLDAPARLSEMAASGLHGEDSPYFAGWKAYEEDRYDPAGNPGGVIQLGLAENQVSFDMLEEFLREHPGASGWGEGGEGFRESAMFQDYHGLPAFREAMAAFMAELRGGRVRFDPDRIVLTAGATAANELLTFITADPGDALMVPTPYYPGFGRDLRWRTGVEIVPVHCRSSDGFRLTRRALEEAYAAAAAAGVRVRGVLITNPSNPLGTTASREDLEEVLEFTAVKNIHLISDEIYSGSVFASPEFVSVAEGVEARGGRDAERVHIVYSLSKDLGLPGFRVGAVYSYNDEVVRCARRMSSFTLVSSQTQRTLAAMLADGDFTARYIRVNRQRLKERRDYVARRLRAAGVEFLPGNAGLFCWVDLSRWLAGDDSPATAELRLWELLLREAKVNVSPGSSCLCTEPGWFRLCFANVSLSTLDIALGRIVALVEKLSPAPAPPPATTEKRREEVHAC